MEPLAFGTLGYFVALIQVILTDVILAGDNAIVIGLAARNVPEKQRKKAILLGTVGAVVVRAISTLLILKLLSIPGLMPVGGALLVWVGYNLLTDDGNHEITARSTLVSAVRTIVLADALMGIDNVLAVSGAADGTPSLVIIGLLVSIPIMIWGSTFFVKWVDRYPQIIAIGAGIILFTAGKMITDSEYGIPIFFEHQELKWPFIIVLVAVTLYIGLRRKEKYRNR